MRYTGKKYFLITFVLLMIFGIFSINWLKHGKKESPFQFENDVDQHYSYLVGGIIKKDLSLSFPHGYWLYEAPNGKPIQRVTMGLAYLYSPFFLIGHAVALSSDKYEANGYTKPYSIAMHLGSLFFVLLGVYFLMLCLNQYYNARMSVFLALLILFGTNLFYYSFGIGEFSHSYLFTLNVFFIYLTIKWHNLQDKRILFAMGLLFGLMVLIRPTEIFLMAFPLLYRVYDQYTLQWKLDLLKQNWKWILVAVFLFFIPILPQMIYWKTYGGQWIVYSYGKEGFFFNNPHIIDYLFSYRKGWFVFTPLMFLAVIGLFFSFVKSRAFSWSILVFLLPTIYMFSSWWCWWYGCGCWSRAFHLTPAGSCSTQSGRC